MMNFLKKPASKTSTAPATPGTAPQTGSAPKPAAGVEAKPTPSVSPAPAQAPAKSLAPLPTITISQEAIAQAAYFRWQRFGGDEATNWRMAEAELRDEAARLGISV